MRAKRNLESGNFSTPHIRHRCKNHGGISFNSSLPPEPYVSLNKSCCSKERYQTRNAANLELHKYRAQVLFSNMNVYRCPIHNCFHLGHDRYMTAEEIIRTYHRMSIVPPKTIEKPEVVCLMHQSRKLEVAN